MDRLWVETQKIEHISEEHMIYFSLFFIISYFFCFYVFFNVFVYFCFLYNWMKMFVISFVVFGVGLGFCFVGLLWYVCKLGLISKMPWFPFSDCIMLFNGIIGLRTISKHLGDLRGYGQNVVTIIIRCVMNYGHWLLGDTLYFIISTYYEIHHELTH